MIWAIALVAAAATPAPAPAAETKATPAAATKAAPVAKTTAAAGAATVKLAPATPMPGMTAKPAAATVVGPTAVAAAAPLRVPTPYTERVLTFAAIDKRTGLTREFVVKPGATVAFETLTIRVRTCETTPAWEQKQTAAFLQIFEPQGKAATSVKVFSGWMFAESPSLNPLEHPRYDVWVRNCAMSFPETGPDTVVASGGDGSAPKRATTPAAPGASSAKKSPEPASAPSN
jgi:hypothetical protein